MDRINTRFDRPQTARAARSPVALLVTVLLLAPPACQPQSSNAERNARTSGAQYVDRVVSLASVAGETFRGILTEPETGAANGWGILMIGGGMGNDLDWTTPGTIVHEGNTTQLTISGQAHSDAPVLASALALRGFSVLRWSTIAIDDPLAEHWPMQATPRSQAQLIDQATSAIDFLRSFAVEHPSHIILLAHSQGAVRACTILLTDPDIAGLVALAPAYFTHADEQAATLARHGLCTCEEALLAHPRPVLALFGALDGSRAVNADAATMLAGQEHMDQLEVKVFATFGHQLGAFHDARHGPIDPQVVADIAAWCEELVRASD